MQSSGIYDLGPFNRGFHVDADGRLLVNDINVSYVNIQDQKSQGSFGGTFTLGDWRTRDLNVIVSDKDNLTSLAANRITLQPGDYIAAITAPASAVDNHKARLRQILPVVQTLLLGTAEREVVSAVSRSFVAGRFSIPVKSELEVQHICVGTAATVGFGQPAGVGGVEIYTTVELFRIGD